jgi:hypothetical protein
VVTRDELNAIKSARLGNPVDDSQHFYVCETCGQAVDKRRLVDVIHHERGDHERIPADSAE